MSIFGDDGYDDLLSINMNKDDQLPDVSDDNDQVFGSSDQTEGDNQQSGVPIKVEPKKRNVLNPRPRLNIEVLRGQRGLHTIEDYFKDIKFEGKGHEKEDLDEVMRRLQHWGHRMYPTYKFDDVLTNIERLGKKKALQVYMSRYRLGMLESMKNHDEVDDKEDDDLPPAAIDEPYDEFDALLDEQIAISKIGTRTPGSNYSRHYDAGRSSTNASVYNNSFDTSYSKLTKATSTPCTIRDNFKDTSDLATPLPPSQPLNPIPEQQLNEEQMARIAENKRLAQKRLAAKKRLRDVQKSSEF